MVNIFSKIKSLFSKREEECREIQSTPMKVNNVTFKDYCALVMNGAKKILLMILKQCLML